MAETQRVREKELQQEEKEQQKQDLEVFLNVNPDIKAMKDTKKKREADARVAEKARKSEWKKAHPFESPPKKVPAKGRIHCSFCGDEWDPQRKFKKCSNVGCNCRAVSCNKNTCLELLALRCK
jgi:hypothetical protein